MADGANSWGIRSDQDKTGWPIDIGSLDGSRNQSQFHPQISFFLQFQEECMFVEASDPRIGTEREKVQKAKKVSHSRDILEKPDTEPSYADLNAILG